VISVNPEFRGWGSLIKTNAILADIYDVLQAINNNLVAVGNHKRSKKIKPYPRPKDKRVKKIGDAAMSMEDMRKWLDERRRKRGRQH
jgi:hypothetical protein